MGAENSHDLPSVRQRTKKTGLTQIESKGLRTWNTDVWGQEKVDVPAQTENRFALPPPFLLFRLSVD